MPPHRHELKGFDTTGCEYVSITPGDDLTIKATDATGTEVTGLTLDPDAATLTAGVAFLPRQVDDSGMSATSGVFGEIVVNVDDSKAYLCTVAHATAATWSALN